MLYVDLPEDPDLELVRVSSVDDRYVLSDLEGAIAAGDRYAITRALAASSHNLDPEQVDALFVIADEMGGNTRRSAWGIGRYIYHVFTFGAEGIILGKSFGTFVDDIEMGRDIEEAGGEVTGNSDTSLVFNRIRFHHLYAGMDRAGIPIALLDDLTNHEMPSIRSLSRDFQASVIDIGSAVVGELGATYESDEKRHLDILWWGAAASFLLTDVMVDETFLAYDDVVSAGMSVVGEFTGLDVREILDVFASRFVTNMGVDDIRALLLRSASGEGYALPRLGQLMRDGVDAASINAMLGAGVDIDFAAAVAG